MTQSDNFFVSVALTLYDYIKSYSSYLGTLELFERIFRLKWDK
jgi:hypothetical protein